MTVSDVHFREAILEAVGRKTQWGSGRPMQKYHLGVQRMENSTGLPGHPFGVKTSLSLLAPGIGCAFLLS